MTAGVNSAYFTVCAWLLVWDSLQGACRQRNEFTLLSVPMPCHVSNIATTLVLILSTQSAIQHAGKINMLLTVTSKLWGGTASCPGSTTGIFWWAVTSRSSLPSTSLGSCSEYIYAYSAIHINTNRWAKTAPGTAHALCDYREVSSQLCTNDQ